MLRSRPGRDARTRWRRTPVGAPTIVLSVLLVGVAVSLPGQEVTLTVATTEYTADWNPISASTYPAQLVTRLVTESLFEKTCEGGGSSETQPLFANVCSAASGVEAGALRLRFDPQRCPGIGVSDVAYTLEQIRGLRRNEYNLYNLALSGEVLEVGRPRQPDEWVAKTAFCFPLLRRPGSPAPSEVGRLFETKMTTGTENLYNRVTNGPFKVEKISSDFVNLSRRTGTNATDRRVDRVSVQYYPLFRTLQDTMDGMNPPDVVLSWPLRWEVGSRPYQPRKPEDLGSFTYVGFNFKVSEPASQQLLQLRRFRELFTKSLWATRTVQQQVGGKDGGEVGAGIFLGESFDSGSPAVVDRPEEAQLRVAVRSFLQDEALGQGVRLRVLVAPGLESILDRSDRANLEEDLNSLWQPEGVKGIRFEMLDPVGGPNRFMADRQSGRYPLILDTFIHRGNHLAYMAFLQPGNELNDLGVSEKVVKGFSRAEVGRMMEAGPKGVVEFLGLVEREYPVAVIGEFPTRDLVSNRLKTPGCGPGAQPMPFAGFETWEKVAGDRPK